MNDSARKVLEEALAKAERSEDWNRENVKDLERQLEDFRERLANDERVIAELTEALRD